MAWSGAKPRSVANASLLVRIRESFALSGRTYGSRRYGSADVVSTCYCEAEAGRALRSPFRSHFAPYLARRQRRRNNGEWHPLSNYTRFGTVICTRANGATLRGALALKFRQSNGNATFEMSA